MVPSSVAEGTSVAFVSMSETQVVDAEGDTVRRLRLRSDGARPLAVNLKETISLTRKLFELRDAAQRARERTGV